MKNLATGISLLVALIAFGLTRRQLSVTLRSGGIEVVSRQRVVCKWDWEQLHGWRWRRTLKGEYCWLELVSKDGKAYPLRTSALAGRTSEYQKLASCRKSRDQAITFTGAGRALSSAHVRSAKARVPAFVQLIPLPF